MIKNVNFYVRWVVLGVFKHEILALCSETPYSFNL